MGADPNARNNQRGSSLKAFANFFKQLFGAGILTLPRAFTTAGIITGTAVWSLVVSLCAASLLLLVSVRRDARTRLEAQHLDESAVDALIGTYPALARHLCGRWSYPFVAFAVVTLELAFCAGWVIVSSECIATVFGGALSGSALASFLATQWHVTAALFPILCALSLIRFLRDMWWLSVGGFFVYIFGVIGVVMWDVAAQQAAPVAVPLVAFDARFPGTALYTLEAVLMALPMERSLRTPAHAPAIIVTSLVLYATIAVVFAIVAALFGLGSCAGGSIVMDCMPGGWSTTAVRLAIAATMVRFLFSFHLFRD